MRMKLLLFALLAPTAVGLTVSCSRRAALASAAVSLVPASIALPCFAAEPEPLRVLTEEEMAERVARKAALLRAQDSGRSLVGSGSLYESDIRSDVNPEAGVNLRSRSVVENARAAMAKQDEMAKRDKQKKRDDLCEMLGRGC